MSSCSSRVERLAASCAMAAIVSIAGCATSDAPLPAGHILPFVTHADFFSNEIRQPVIIDPQVFVVSPGAPAATGVQNIPHVEGRSAVPSDASATRLLTANVKPLDLTAGEWLMERGTVTLAPRPDGSERVDVRLRGLEPAGVYSLFENHSDRRPVGFTPLDGDERSNSFVADRDGSASLTLVVPHRTTHANAVLLVYHSDGDTHGLSRGSIGVDAHHQSIVRIS